MPSTSLANAAVFGSGEPLNGGRRRGASVKTLKRMLKKAGLKTTGRKAALTRRAKKAHLKMRGGDIDPATGMERVVVKGGACEVDGQGNKVDPNCVDGGRRRRRHSRKH